MILNITPLDFQWQTADPFLFCAYHRDDYPPGNDVLGPAASLAGRNIGMDFQLRDGWRMYHGDRIPGFPGHPHRGFETVTIVSEGMVDHADSLGAAGRYGNGDVQWMSAGRGVQHSEMFPLLNKTENNPLLLFQIWLNLPSRNKMTEPHFAMFWAEELPVIEEVDAQGKSIRLTQIAGVYKQHQPLSPPPDSWANDPNNAVAIWLLELEAGASWTLPECESGVNRTLYFYDGDSLSITGQELTVLHSARMSPAAATLRAGKAGVKILVLQGRPIGEKVAQHGPFVMNNREELMQAFTDYQRDQFGGWPWENPDQVHGQRGRFARFTDGKEEVPPVKDAN